MIWWRIVIGVFLVLCSSYLTGWIFDHYSVSMSIGGSDYAEVIANKILDAVGGSLIVWGILKNPRK